MRLILLQKCMRVPVGSDIPLIAACWPPCKALYLPPLFWRSGNKQQSLSLVRIYYSTWRQHSLLLCASMSFKLNNNSSQTFMHHLFINIKCLIFYLNYYRKLSFDILIIKMFVIITEKYRLNIIRSYLASYLLLGAIRLLNYNSTELTY